MSCIMSLDVVHNSPVGFNKKEMFCDINPKKYAVFFSIVNLRFLFHNCEILSWTSPVLHRLSLDVMVCWQAGSDKVKIN